MSLLASLDDRVSLSINGSGVSKNKPNDREPIVRFVGHEDSLLSFLIFCRVSFIHRKYSLEAGCHKFFSLFTASAYTVMIL
jgi:hypothetical protein